MHACVHCLSVTPKGLHSPQRPCAASVRPSPPETLAAAGALAGLRAWVSFPERHELKSSSTWRFRVAPFPGAVLLRDSVSLLWLLALFSSLCNCFYPAPVRHSPRRSTCAVTPPGLLTPHLLLLFTPVAYLLFHGLFFGVILETLTSGFLEVSCFFFLVYDARYGLSLF